MYYKKIALMGALGALFFVGLSQTVLAVTCEPGLTTPIAGVCVPTNASTGLSDQPVVTIILTFMNWIFAIFGFIAIIAFVISGLQYMFASGDEHMAETAKRNMTYSVVGVIVALAAWVIIQAIDAALSTSNPLF